MKSALDEADRRANGQWHTERLRDWYFPVFTRMFYELVFGERACPKDFEGLSNASANNVISALKCTTLRDMALRGRLTDVLEERIRAGACAGVFDDSDPKWALSAREKALHLQGVFFHTGAVQMSEAMAHLSLALAQSPRVQAKLWQAVVSGASGGDGDYVDLVIDEALRRWPLFGVAHRIASTEVSADVDGVHVSFPAGTVLCFSYPEFHTGPGCGFDEPLEFRPERFETISRRATTMSFGERGRITQLAFS